jgi:hypothetical protein
MKLLILSDLHLEFHPMRVPPGDFDAEAYCRVSRYGGSCRQGRRLS